jgi:hypothetical protein
MIVEQHPIESDEDILHKHHEQFERLVSLLSTDIGDSSISSLRSMVVEWEQDPVRGLLPVSTGGVGWVLQKSSSDGTDGCTLCAKSGIRCGLVLDTKLDVISRTEADILAEYLTLAIQQSNQQPTEEETSRLEYIRDNPAPRPAPIAPSLRDDVSVSVRNDMPFLSHSIERIRQRDAEQVQKLKVQAAAGIRSQTPDEPAPGPGSLLRKQTGEIDVLSDLVSNFGSTRPPRQRLDSETTIVPLVKNDSVNKAQRDGTEKPVAKPPTPKKPISVLFLSTSHLRKYILSQSPESALTEIQTAP